MERVLSKLALGAILSGAVCCTSPDVPSIPDVEANTIRISAGIGEITKATVSEGIYKSFQPGDEISVFVWTGTASSGSLSLEQTVINNTVNCYEGNSQWEPESPMIWAESEDGTPIAHTFRAIYPSVGITMPGKLEGFYAAEKGLVKDVLVACVDGQIPTSEPVMLTFDHVMACLEVNLNLRSEYDGVDPASVHVSADAATDAYVDYIEATSNASGSVLSCSLAASADGLKHTVVLPAQTVPMKIVLSIGDVTRTLNPGDDLVLEAGKRTTVNLNVGKDVIELSGISVDSWSDGDLIRGEAQLYK